MKKYDTICPNCGGLIARPGKTYGWGGDWCICSDEDNPINININIRGGQNEAGR